MSNYNRQELSKLAEALDFAARQHNQSAAACRDAVGVIVGMLPKEPPSEFAADRLTGQMEPQVREVNMAEAEVAFAQWWSANYSGVFVSMDGKYHAGRVMRAALRSMGLLA